MRTLAVRLIAPPRRLSCMTVGVFTESARRRRRVGRRRLPTSVRRRPSHSQLKRVKNIEMGLMKQYLCAPGTTSSLHTSLPRALTRRKPRPGKPQSFEARAPRSPRHHQPRPCAGHTQSVEETRQPDRRQDTQVTGFLCVPCVPRRDFSLSHIVAKPIRRRGHAHRARRSLIETDDPRSQAGRAGRPPADPAAL